jgi:hypothetical protein
MTTDRFVSQLDKQERFAMDVVDEPKVFVKGDERDFAQLVKDRAAR